MYNLVGSLESKVEQRYFHKNQAWAQKPLLGEVKAVRIVKFRYYYVDNHKSRYWCSVRCMYDYRYKPENVLQEDWNEAHFRGPFSNKI